MREMVLVLNAGSSSLKFSAFEITDSTLNALARGQVEGIGGSPRFIASDPHGQRLGDVELSRAPGQVRHSDALAYVSNWVREHYADRYSVVAVGHRIVHGGLKFTSPTLIDASVIQELTRLIPLAPLHQPHNLEAVREVARLRPGLPQVACFDTAFHQGRPRVTERFGIPDELFRQGIRRWGFHGLSYESIANQFRDIAPSLAKGRVIVAHLGNGASLCAMRDGRSIDTTMSFSTLDGLPMGTRCGGLDPGVVLFLLQRGNSAVEIEDLLYRKSGLLGISGVSHDVRELLNSQSPLAKEAIDYFVHRIVCTIGSLTAALGGLDGLVFTAGVGQNSTLIRARVCQALSWLNIVIDAEMNQRNATCISPPGHAPSVWIVPTDEERVIASHTLRVLRSVHRGTAG